MKLLITGSRGWHDEAPINAIINHFKTESEVAGDPFVLIHGHAKSGADALADKVGHNLGLLVIREAANWKRYGAGAGPIRNQLMLDKYEPDVVVAFRATGKSNGTDDMIGRAEKAGVPCHIIRTRDDALHVTHA